MKADAMWADQVNWVEKVSPRYLHYFGGKLGTIKGTFTIKCCVLMHNSYDPLVLA